MAKFKCNEKLNSRTALLVKYLFFFFCLLSLHIKKGVQMYFSLSVGMWRANGNPNPCMDLDKIFAGPWKVQF